MVDATGTDEDAELEGLGGAEAPAHEKVHAATSTEEELEVLGAHLTELSLLCRRRFSELAGRKEVAQAREELDTLRGHVDDLEKRVLQRMDRVEGMKVVDEVERLVELTERSDRLRQEVKAEVRKAELLAGEMEKFSKDRTFLEETIGKVVDLATTVERSSGAVDRHLEGMNDAVLSLQRGLAALEDRLRRMEAGPGPGEEHLVELETRLKLLEELTERLEHLSGDRMGDLRGDTVALKSRVAKLEASLGALEERQQKRQLEWEDTIRKEFALLDGRVLNIEKSLVRRIEQVEHLERQQEKHLESMDSLVAAVREFAGRRAEAEDEERERERAKGRFLTLE